MSSQFHRTAWRTLRFAGLCCAGCLCQMPAAFAQAATETPAEAQSGKPLWEASLGVADVVFPAYRGAKEIRNFVLPMPYLVYRGDWLKADRNGVRGIFLDSERVELNLSLNASPPVSSSQIAARRNMPDLRPTLEIGPSLDVRLWQTPDGSRKLRLMLPLRAGITLEGSPQFIGWQSSAKLNLDLDSPAGLQGWHLGLQAGVVHNSRQHNEYFYQVAARYALPDRPAWRAGSGHAGTQFLATLSRRFPGYWVGGFLRYDNLGGASFASSPLVTSRHYLAGGIAVAWLLGESATRVARTADDY